MKIVQISGAYVGAQKIIEHSIHKELINQGHESLVLYAIGASDEKGIVCYENTFSSLCRRVLRKIFGKNPRFARGSTKRLIRRLKLYQPDVVHLHVLHQGYLDYEMLFRFLNENKISIVYTMHDMWAFTGGCYYYTKENCLKFQTGCKECRATSNRLDNSATKTAKYFKLKKQLLSQFDRIQFVAVSQWVADEMQKSFLSEYPVMVIGNGIEVVPVQNGVKDEINSDNHINVISVAAAWNERKGIYRIFEIARMLGNKYNILLIGTASQNIIDSAPKNVRFLGYINDKSELLRMYAEADIHMSASFEETFGMTFVEAAFVGTRSVGYDSSAVTSTLQGVEGIAVKELTSEAMVREIEAIVDRGNMKLTPEEVKRILQKYSSDAMAKKYCAVYLSLLAE